MGKIVCTFVLLLAIGIVTIDGVPSRAKMAIDSICNRVVLLLQTTINIIYKLLTYLIAQIDQLMYDVVDELLGNTVKCVTDFLENIFVADTYKNIVSKIPEESRNTLKKIFNAFAKLLSNIIHMLSCTLKVIGELVGRHSLLKEFTILIETMVDISVKEIQELTKDRCNNPQVILMVKDAANDLTQCSNIVLRGVTTEIEYVNTLVDNSGLLVTKILQSLLKCLSMELGSMEKCLCKLVESSSENLNEMKGLITIQKAQPIAKLLIDTYKCMCNVKDNLKINLDTCQSAVMSGNVVTLGPY